MAGVTYEVWRQPHGGERNDRLGFPSGALARGVRGARRGGFQALPAPFRGLCEGVVVRVENFPDDETLREMDYDSPFDLLGLFRGVGMAQGGASLGTGQFPNMVWLYRRPILDYWAEHEETLGSLVTHVLVHEIGHHFGLSDPDREAIEAAAEESRTEVL